MEIRRLKSEDWADVDRGMAGLHALHVRNRPDVYLPREHVLPEKVFEQMCESPDHVLLCAEEGEKMAGFVLASVRNRSFMANMLTLYAEELYVFPEWRRKGVAAEMMRALEDAGRAHGCVRVDLMVWEFNAAARELYASCGYTCQSRILEKKLGPETE